MAPGGPRLYLYTSLLPHKSKIVYPRESVPFLNLPRKVMLKSLYVA